MFAKNRGIYRKLKGQYTLYALFMTFVIIVCFSVLYAPLKAIIDDAVPGMDESTAMLLTASLFIIFLFILFGAYWYVAPQREEK
jgi:uncharacterized BrkB/YihY/UPF0761 family membrane protein